MVDFASFRQGPMAYDSIEVTLPLKRPVNTQKCKKADHDCVLCLSILCVFQNAQAIRESDLLLGIFLSLLPDHIVKLLESTRANRTLPIKQLVGCLINWINHIDFSQYLSQFNGSLLLFGVLGRLISEYGIRSEIIVCKSTPSSTKSQIRMFIDCYDCSVEMANTGKFELMDPIKNRESIFGFILRANRSFCCGFSEIKSKQASSKLRNLLEQLGFNFDGSHIINDRELEVPQNRKLLKNHGTFILESDLKKYEAVYPKDIAGFFESEPVFYKKNLNKIRSKEAWLTQFGRVIKVGEEAVKVVNLSAKSIKLQQLYGEWQTTPYEPPIAKDGIVPRNDHGNVDLFTQSMLPQGCSHIILPGADKIAKEMGIDYADACTGFSFRGGRATPDLCGIVICTELLDEFRKTYDHKWKIIAQTEEMEKNAKCLSNWEKAIDAVIIGRKLKTNSSSSAPLKASWKNVSTQSETDNGSNLVQSIFGTRSDGQDDGIFEDI